MGLVHWLLASPLKGVVQRAYCGVAHLADRLLNIRTEDDSMVELAPAAPLIIETAPGAVHTDNYRNQAAAYWTIRRTFRQLRLRSDDVFVDIGCGLGRVICVAARQPLRRVVGIELMEHYAEQARVNVSRLRGRRAPVEVICDDAATADLGNGTVYYLFNPFGAETLRDFLANLRESIRRNPRPVRLCYGSPRHEEVLAECGFLELYDEFRTLGGSRVLLWRLKAGVMAGGTRQPQAVSRAVNGVLAAACTAGNVVVLAAF